MYVKKTLHFLVCFLFFSIFINTLFTNIIIEDKKKNSKTSLFWNSVVKKKLPRNSSRVSRSNGNSRSINSSTNCINNVYNIKSVNSIKKVNSTSSGINSSGSSSNESSNNGNSNNNNNNNNKKNRNLNILKFLHIIINHYYCLDSKQSPINYTHRSLFYNVSFLLNTEYRTSGNVQNRKTISRYINMMNISMTSLSVMMSFLYFKNYMPYKLFDTRLNKTNIRNGLYTSSKKNIGIVLNGIKEEVSTWAPTELHIYTNHKKEKTKRTTTIQDRNIFESNFAFQTGNEGKKKKNSFDRFETETTFDNTDTLIKESKNEKHDKNDNEIKTEKTKTKRKLSEKSLKSMKEKLKKIMKEKWKNPEFRNKMTEAIRKRNRGHNKKISETIKKKWKYDENYKKKTLDGQRKYILDRKNKNANKVSEETKSKISKAMKLYWMSRIKFKKKEIIKSSSSILKKRKRHKKLWEDIYSIILNQKNDDNINNYQILHNLSVNLDATYK